MVQGLAPSANLGRQYVGPPTHPRQSTTYTYGFMLCCPLTVRYALVRYASAYPKTALSFRFTTLMLIVYILYSDRTCTVLGVVHAWVGQNVTLLLFGR